VKENNIKYLVFYLEATADTSAFDERLPCKEVKVPLKANRTGDIFEHKADL